MAANRETLKLMGQIRIRIGDTVDQVTEDLVRSWALAWKLVASDWEAAVFELQAQSVDGKWPSHTVVMRAERAQAALEATYRGLTKLTDDAGVTIIAGLSDVVEAAQGHADVIASQLPTTATELRTSLVRADAHQIHSIVVRTQEQVTKRLFPLAGDSYDIIRSTLIRGVAAGANPKVAARQMVEGIQVGHSEALTRAMNIARTEMLDAHRDGALTVRKVNADVLQGWEWIAALDKRTCPSCWGQHGSIHPVDEPGPNDHQQGRCAGMPVTRPWADLGFDLEEPPSLVPDARTVFDAMPQADKLTVMGPGRMALLDSGDVDLTDLSTLRHNPGWRDSHAVTPLRSLTPSS